jgi:DNA-binding IclR family transcriptional regulator
MSEEEDAAPTVKSIARAASILRELASLPAGGGALTDIAKRVGMGKATTHRILAALADVGFAYQNAETRRYHLGAGFALLSQRANRLDVGRLAEPFLMHLARQTEDTIYVVVPEGLRSVCVGREQGAYPIKTLSLDVGQSRPLGVGSASLAILAFLPTDEIESAIEANSRWMSEFPNFGPDVVRRLVERTQAQGYSFVEGNMTPGINAIGVPVFGETKRPVAALSVTAIADRVRGERAIWLASLLRNEAEALSKHLIAHSRGI